MATKSKPVLQRGSSAIEKGTWFDRLSPSKKDIFCLMVLYFLVLILFHKIVLYNMIFSDSPDIATVHAWVTAAEHIKQTEHIEQLWFPYVFCGMPGFGSLSFAPRDINYLQTAIHSVGKFLFLNGDASGLVLLYFLMGIFMFLLARQMKFSHLPALIASLTLMLNPYAIELAGVGHGSKLVALSYIPLLFLLTHNLFERRNILNLGLLSAAIGTQLLSNHVQMVFYSFIVIGGYLLYDIILNIKKEPTVAVKKTASFVLALMIGFAISAYVYLSVQEYAPYSIRGGGEAGVSGGLTYKYATDWSFHPFETLNYLIPSFFGFSSNYITDWQGQQTMLPLYWGWMPFTTSTVYIGVVPLFLGILALIYKRNRMTIFLSILSFFVLLLSFGRHLGLLYDLMFYYFPFFNKFRSPAMILYLIPFTFGLLAAYGTSFFMELHERAKEINLLKIRKRVLIILGTLGVLLILGFIGKSGIYNFLSDFMFVKEGDIQQYGPQVVNALKEKRFDVLWGDYIKFVLLSGAFIGLILFYLDRKIQRTTLMFGFIGLMIFDLYIIDVKYIEPKPKTAITEHFQQDATIQFLKSDTTLYRIFPLQSLFMDNSWMYHTISSIGGYSPAKLRSYQEMIDSSLYHGSDSRFPLNMNVVNMLNTKYFVAQSRLPEGKLSLVNVDESKTLLTYLNPDYLPRAYFVDSMVIARSKTQTFAYMNLPTWDPKITAILEKVPTPRPTKSDSSIVNITKYGSREIVLKTYSTATSLLVVSEAYYPAGWKAYIDGSETEIYKTNYVLRSVVVPRGNHVIEFRFDPALYSLGLTITNASWGLTLILILVGIFQVPQVRKKLGMGKKEESSTVVV